MDTAEGDPYRPCAIGEMAGASDWTRLQTLITQQVPPNIVLVGPAGIGKSCALRVTLKGHISMWLRCSQDPTLRESRDRIKAAARRRVVDGTVQWIILEHADLLHTDAQAFLRRIIETSMGATRFVLEVRDVAAIAEPLLSRTVLFNAPQLVAHEIRSEIQRRAPSVSLDVAEKLAYQSSGNIRWAILQGLGGSDGMIDATLPPVAEVTSWQQLLSVMEQLQQTGTNPRAWLRDTSPVWERAGGACPWSITAHQLAKHIVNS